MLNTELQQAEKNFLELVAKNQPRILRICRAYAWNPQDQEDLYQEVLLQIWRSLSGLKDPATASTWLYRVALNTAISFVRKQAPRRDRVSAFSHEQIRQAAEQRQPAEEQDSAELAALYEVIAKLDGVEKARITLFLEDLSYEEIAEVMGLNPGHVGVLLHRVKKKLSSLIHEVRT